MKLSYVNIKNFRSIQDIKMDFDPPCRVLVGINESGKSNIINALALLNDDYVPVKSEDLREALPNENEIKESYVRFVLNSRKKNQMNYVS